MYPFELDKPRNFKYGMRALSLIEKKLKLKISNFNPEDLTIEQTAVVIWAGLEHEERDLTVEKVIDLIDEHSSYTEAMMAMSKGLTLAMAGEEALEQMERELEHQRQGEKPKALHNTACIGHLYLLFS